MASLPAWVNKLIAEAGAHARVQEMTSNNSTNVIVDAGDFAVRNNIDLRRGRYASPFGKYNVRVISRDQGESASIAGSQFDNPDPGNDAKLVERLWRDACSVLRTGVKPPRKSSAGRGLQSLLGVLKFPMWLATLLSQADEVRWVVFGEDSSAPYERWLLLSFDAPGVAPFERDEMRFLRAGRPGVLATLVQLQ